MKQVSGLANSAGTRMTAVALYAGTVVQIWRERGGTDQYECGEHVVRLLRRHGRDHGAPHSSPNGNRTGRRRSGPQRWNISPPASRYVLPDIVGTFGNAGEAASNMRTRIRWQVPARRARFDRAARQRRPDNRLRSVFGERVLE
jgi:hypothetical protein